METQSTSASVPSEAAACRLNLASPAQYTRIGNAVLQSLAWPCAKCRHCMFDPPQPPQECVLRKQKREASEPVTRSIGHQPLSSAPEGQPYPEHLLTLTSFFNLPAVADDGHDDHRKQRLREANLLQKRRIHGPPDTQGLV